MEEFAIEALANNRNALTGNVGGIYFLFLEGKLVYIGKGWNCLLRVAEHTGKDSDKIFDSWNFVPVESESERSQLEKDLIYKYEPKYNKTYKSA